MTERTLSIVKPDAVQKNVIGEILRRFEAASLKIVATKMVSLSKAEAEGFYAVHKERPFFGSLTDFMSSGPILVSVLEGEGGYSSPPVWERPILLRRLRAQSGRILPRISNRMRCMALMRPKRPNGKSVISLVGWNSPSSFLLRPGPAP